MTEGQQRGPGWFDVNVALRTLERKWDVHIAFKLVADVTQKGRKHGLLVVLDATKADRTAWEKTVPGYWSQWPHPDHRTMPGLMLKLLHKFDERLEEKALETQKTAQPALPF